MVVTFTGFTLFATSCSRLQTNVLANFFDTTCILFSLYPLSLLVVAYNASL